MSPLDMEDELSSVVEDSEDEEELQMSQKSLSFFMQGTGCAQDQNSLSSFLTARALLADNLLKKEVFLSPGFRSMAAKAGWDDESLLMATDDDQNGSVVGDSTNEARSSSSSSSSSSSLVFAATVDHSSQVRRKNHERKREERTPQHTVTPLSAGRRCRRSRRQTIHGSSPECLPIGDLSLNEDFKKEANQPQELTNEGESVQQEEAMTSSGAGSHGDPQPKTTVSETCASPQCRGALLMGQALTPGIPVEVSDPNHGVVLDAGSTGSKPHSPPKQSEIAAPANSKPTSQLKKSDDAEASSSNQKPGCLEQLREELSCAICLDICYEPSTTSCGHSFCRRCLQSVLEKCGPRCPKCRQHLRGDTWRGCQLNIVLWNTVQLLFPAEAAARAAAAKEMGEKKAVAGSRASDRPHNVESSTQEGARGRETWQRARPAVAGLRRRAAYSGRIGNFLGRQSEEVLLSSSSSSSSMGQSEAAADTSSIGMDIGGHDSSNHSRQQQEEADALFARRLQQPELMGSTSTYSASWSGNSVLNRNRGGSNSNSSSTSVANAAANLRAVVQHAIRQTVRNS